MQKLEQIVSKQYLTKLTVDLLVKRDVLGPYAELELKKEFCDLTIIIFHLTFLLYPKTETPPRLSCSLPVVDLNLTTVASQIRNRSYIFSTRDEAIDAAMHDLHHPVIYSVFTLT